MYILFITQIDFSQKKNLITIQPLWLNLELAPKRVSHQWSFLPLDEKKSQVNVVW
jgi:hypothetical protein